MPPHQNDEVRISDVWRALTSHKRRIARTTLATTALATTFALLSTPTYRAEVLIAPSRTNQDTTASSLAGQFGGLAGLAGISLSGDAEVATALATLTSRAFLSRFITNHNLKPILFSPHWDSDTGQWTSPKKALITTIAARLPIDSAFLTTALDANEPTDWESYEIFKDDILSVTQDMETGLVTVAVEWEDPDRAAEWANQLVAQINAELSQRAIERAEQAIAYLREQVNQTTLADLRLVLFRLIEEHTKTVTLAKATDAFAFEVIDPAVPPEKAIRPRRFLIIIAGLMFGFLLAASIALGRGQPSTPIRIPPHKDDALSNH